MTIIAYKAEISDPELLGNYQRLLKATGAITGGTVNKRLESQATDAIEETLAKYYGGRVSEQAKRNVARVPDLEITSPRLARALSRAFGGQDESDFLRAEVKAKRSDKKYGATIGQGAYSDFAPGLLDVLKLGALQAQKENLLQKDKYFEKNKFDVNDPESVLRAVRAKIGGGGFFNLIRDNDPTLHMEFYAKTKNLLISKAVITKKRVTSVSVINIFFPKSSFTSPPFTTELKDKSIQYNLSSTFEKKLLTELESTGPAIVAKTTDEFAKSLETISGKRKLSEASFKDSPPLNFEILFGVPTGGSIPRLNAKVKPGKQKVKEVVKDTSQFISSIQLTVLLRNRIQNKMPTVGEPNPTEGLKYRTGRFVNSLQFMIDYKKNLISYYADPPVDEYFDKFHRRPYAVGQRLIRPTIRQTAQELFGRQFKIIKT